MTTEMKNMLPVGTTLQGGKYRIVKYLSSGGFGNTYEIINTKFDAQLALKEFFMHDINERREDNTVSISHPEKTEQFCSHLRKFQREAQRIYKIHNEHVIRVHDLFDENDTSYYVMDYIQGESLSERIKRTGMALPENEVRMLLGQLLDALEVVHNQHIWHLDLKPGNILLGNNGKVTLIDFGASKQLDGSDGLATTTKSMAYTRGYAPLEQMGQKLENVGPWSDFYALGATLYTLLTMNTPPEANELINNKDVLVFPQNVSPQMQQLVCWMMQLSISKRPQSVNDIRRFLSNNYVFNDETVVSEPPKTTWSEKTQVINQKIDKTNKPAIPAVKNTKDTSNNNTFTYAVPNHAKKSSVRKWIFGILGLAAFGIIGQNVTTCISKRAEVLNKEEKDAIIQNLKANMVHVEGGTFLMGENSNSYQTDAMPVHKVTVSSFSIGKYEVTQEEWMAVMDENPSYFKEKKEDAVSNVIMGRKSKYAKCPVERVSWDDCQRFIAKLNDITGLRFRLPTEAEWEYAAIGGLNSKWYTFSGSNSIDSVAWWNGEIHEVGKKSPNELGLYDMSGNVSEWCGDYYGGYSPEAQINPTGPSTNNDGYVYRGGSYSDSNRAKCAVFARSHSHFAGSYIGLRLVLSE